MKLSEIVKTLNLEVCCGNCEVDVRYGVWGTF